MRSTWRIATVGLLVVGLGASACSKNTGNTPEETEKKKLDAKLIYVDDAKGPAPQIPGAKKGGTITILHNADFDHFYPPATYRGDAILVGTQLTLRTLVGIYEENNQTQVMGDLATDTGKSEDNCKKWTYTLRDGLKFEDGTTITSRHIAEGISTAFDELAADGPSYIQRFLAGPDWATVYTGPFQNPGTIAPGISLPDDKTIVFTLKEGHCDFPLLATLPTTAPTQVEKLNPANPESLESPIASGPYKIKSYTRGQRLEFERNPNWDPNSDPLRHNYPDGFIFDFTVPDPDIGAKRVVADQGADKNAILFPDPGTVGLADIDASASAKQRVIEGQTVYSFFTNINTRRITDVDVRRALIYGFNQQSQLQILGGDRAGKPSTTMTSPVNPGFKEFDVYPKPLIGDVEKAKKLLEGKTVPPLTWCYRAGGLRPKQAAAAKEAYARIGVELVLKELDRTIYYNIVGKKDTDCDLIPAGWGQDAPDGSTFLAVMAHPNESKEAGSNNNSFLEVPEIGQKLDEIGAMTDRTEANKLYGELEEKIFKEYAPWIPMYWDYAYTVHGSGVGGAYMSSTWGNPSLQNVYVK